MGKESNHHKSLRIGIDGEPEDVKLDPLYQKRKHQFQRRNSIHTASYEQDGREERGKKRGRVPDDLKEMVAVDEEFEA